MAERFALLTLVAGDFNGSHLALVNAVHGLVAFACMALYPIGQSHTSLKSQMIAALQHWHRFYRVTADPYAIIEPDEDSIPQNLRAKRDRAYAAITPLLDLPGTDQFFGRQRGELIRRTSREKKISKRLIYAYLRRFWQRGHRKNALLPDYDRCGAPGKIRHHSSAKRGRPPEIVSDLGPGINIAEKEQNLILRGFRRFFLNTNGPKPTLKKAYELTLIEFFNKGYEIKRGERLPVMPPREELPSFRQFQYWVSKEPDISEILKIREGDRRFNLRYRALGGDARAGADGPGSEYQIDATPADITLVSSLDRRRVIGRPNIYFLVDVFSGMIAGFSATLEHNSYFAAILALECAIRDKVEFCAEHGITIEADEWPCFGVPDKITADRGELIGKKANQLVTALGIHVSNTPPYRADLKPFVERAFRTLNDELLSLVPGSIKKQRERGDRDTRLDAVFTAEELRKQIILFILNHNRSRVEKMKPRDFMVSADLEPRPIALWNWGLLHRSGHLRSFDPQTTRVNLLPIESARVTEQGIRFRKLFFTCEQAVADQWFTKARAKGSWAVEISYDPRCASVMYVRNSDGKTADPCKLLAACSSFQNCTWDEIEDFFAAGRQQAFESRSTDVQQSADYHTRRAKLAAEASEKTKAAWAGGGPSLKDVRENRFSERDYERKSGTTGLRVSHSQFAKAGNPARAPLKEDEYIEPICDYDLLKQQRDELLNNP